MFKPKFRVWDKERKEWVPRINIEIEKMEKEIKKDIYNVFYDTIFAVTQKGNLIICEGTERFFYVNPKRFEAVFFTGQQDIKKMDIYEGDVLLDDLGRTYIVVWRDGSGNQENGFWFKKTYMDKIFSVTKHRINSNQMSVIGNKREHPHLKAKAVYTP